MPFILLLVLILAALIGKLDIVIALISANASLNIKDANGYTALYYGWLNSVVKSN